MKKLIYAVCVSSLALAVSAGAADNNNNNLPRKGKASTTQAASVKSSSQVSVRRNVNQPHYQQRSVNTARSRVVHQNGVQHYNTSNKVTRSNGSFEANHARSVTVNRRENVDGGVNRNVNRNVTVNRTVNRERNVRVVNNWNSSRFSGSQYYAFRNYHRHYHDRGWYNNYRVSFFFGAPYFWNAGYWYPAYGYGPNYSYTYDGPIYGYNNLTPDQVVVNVQAQLQRDGYYSGPVDGQLGPMTRQALADFQADHGLAVTSAVDEPTLASLGLV